MKKRLVGLFLSTVMVLSLVACGSSASSGETSSSSNDEKTEESVGATEDSQETEKASYKVGFISWTSSHPVATAWNTGIEEFVSTSSSEIQYQMFDGENSAEAQNRLISDLVNQKYDAIILQASDGAAVASSVKDAEAAGVPVICLNLDAEVTHCGFVSMSAYGAGYMVGESMAEQLDGKGKVVVIQGLLGTSAATYRESGFRDAIAKYPEIEIVAEQPADFDKEKAITVMNNFLQTYDHIDGVFGVNDNSAEGAYIAAESAGRQDELVIWGDDGQKSTLEMIEEGKIDGTIYTNCFDQGALAVELAVFAAQSGYDLSTVKNTGVIELAPVAVTKDNVKTIAKEDRWG